VDSSKDFTKIFGHCDFHFWPAVSTGGLGLHCPSKGHDANCAFGVGLSFGAEKEVDGV
jgi:hypothetical protein